MATKAAPKKTAKAARPSKAQEAAADAQASETGDGLQAKGKSKGSDGGKGMAPTSSRALWKGAISFGLVHIPIGLYSATSTSDIDFDWLDKRSMDPVGYKRVNKKTGKEIAMSDIVKGIEWEDGKYVVLTPEEISAAYPRTTQTIEIEAFVPTHEIPFVYLEKPYYTAPVNRGQKVYALLRETLRETDMVGVAKVVIASKQHLALLMPCGPALVLNLLRWGGEIRSFEALELPPQGVKEAGLKDSEMVMARQLVQEMSSSWSAQQFRDSFKDEIMKLVESKAREGHVEEVEKVDTPTAAPGGGNVVDLTELLKRSLGAGKPPPAEKAAPAKKPAAKKASSRVRKAA
jgi:DNA end-binding protein Ku